jgi:hypothetical protein
MLLKRNNDQQKEMDLLKTLTAKKETEFAEKLQQQKTDFTNQLSLKDAKLKE